MFLRPRKVSSQVHNDKLDDIRSLYDHETQALGQAGQGEETLLVQLFSS